MNILITGAGGFVGKNLVCALENIRDGKDRTHPELKIELNALVPLHVLTAVNLRPAGDAGPNLKHTSLLISVFFKRPRVIGERRTRADSKPDGVLISVYRISTSENCLYD